MLSRHISYKFNIQEKLCAKPFLAKTHLHSGQQIRRLPLLRLALISARMHYDALLCHYVLCRFIARRSRNGKVGPSTTLTEVYKQLFNGLPQSYVRHFGLLPKTSNTSISLSSSLCLQLISKHQHANTLDYYGEHDKHCTFVSATASEHCHSEHVSMATLAKELLLTSHIFLYCKYFIIHLFCRSTWRLA